MDGYNRIFILSIVLLFFSMYQEYNNPITETIPCMKDFFYIYCMRWIHYCVYLFTSFYLFLFNGIGRESDRFFYLLFIYLIITGWYLFDYCIYTYSELLFYDMDLTKTKTTFHPAFYYLYGEYAEKIMVVSGILYLITVSVLLYALYSVPFSVKMIMYLLFLYLFFASIQKSRNKVKYYSYDPSPQSNIEPPAKDPEITT